MKIRLIQIGKTDSEYLLRGINEYKNRLVHYIKTEELTLKCPETAVKKGLHAQKIAEGKLIIENLIPGEPLLLLDEHGKEFSSVGFADFLQNLQLQSAKRINFCIGGPFGFSAEVSNLATHKISFSKMTFSHQMIRLFFWEQLYRSNTIIKGEKYHHR
jgi:23S rRNA (pseudouridine1915-N3)-methyltransferase